MIKTAGELNDYLTSLCETEQPSVDRIIAGDKDIVILKAGTCWMPYLETLRKAYEKGVNVMVTHEPAFYSHYDEEKRENEYNRLFETEGKTTARTKYLEMIAEKRKWIEEHEMVIIRCHDVLDRLIGIGIVDAFAEALGFSELQKVAGNAYIRVYEMEETAAGETAGKIAQVLKGLGQTGIAFYGDQQKKIKRIGIGTGCYSDPIELMEYGAELCISIHDVTRTWIQAAYARDTGNPLIVIDHGTSEECGVKSLSTLLEKELKCGCMHFEQGCGFEWIHEELYMR